MTKLDNIIYPHLNILLRWISNMWCNLLLVCMSEAIKTRNTPDALSILCVVGKLKNEKGRIRGICYFFQCTQQHQSTVVLGRPSRHKISNNPFWIIYWFKFPWVILLRCSTSIRLGVGNPYCFRYRVFLHLAAVCINFLMKYSRDGVLCIACNRTRSITCYVGSAIEVRVGVLCVDFGIVRVFACVAMQRCWMCRSTA